MNQKNERLLEPSISRQESPTSEAAAGQAVASPPPISRDTSRVPRVQEQVAPGLRAKLLAIAYRMTAENWRECREQLEELAVGPERFALIKAVCSLPETNGPYDRMGGSVAAGSRTPKE